MEEDKKIAYEYFKHNIKWLDEHEISIDNLKIIFYDFCKYNNFPYIIEPFEPFK